MFQMQFNTFAWLFYFEFSLNKKMTIIVKGFVSVCEVQFGENMDILPSKLECERTGRRIYSGENLTEVRDYFEILDLVVTGNKNQEVETFEFFAPFAFAILFEEVNLSLLKWREIYSFIKGKSTDFVQDDYFIYSNSLGLGFTYEENNEMPLTLMFFCKNYFL